MYKGLGMKLMGLKTVSDWLAGDNENAALPIAELADRSDVFAMTRQAQKAVLAPVDGGVWSHSWRAALAARIASQNNNPHLAEIYRQAVTEQPLVAIANPEFAGLGDQQQAVLSFMDRVATDTKAIAAPDVTVLQEAGISDADIVRLCELNAFLAYQCRVITGIALMVDAEQNGAAK